MNKLNLKKIIIIIFIVFLVSVIILIITKKDKYSEYDTLLYKGNTYVYLEYNMDIFNYYFNNNTYYEIDEIHPIPHDRWDIIYFNGLLLLKTKKKK